MIRIMLIDHHRLIRTGLKALLSQERGIEVVSESAHPDRAVAAAREVNPDVVVINAELPGMGALETTRRLSRLKPAPKIIALGVQIDGPFPTCLLEVGARGYLPKTCRREELVSAIRQGRPRCVLRGRRRRAEPGVEQAAGCAHADVPAHSPGARGDGHGESGAVPGPDLECAGAEPEDREHLSHTPAEKAGSAVRRGVDTPSLCAMVSSSRC